MLLMLGQMRMLADSTFIIDQNLDTRHDVKVSEAMNILSDALEGSDTKVVIFSEWERMARLMAMELDARGLSYAFLHGGVEDRKRNDIIEHFQNDSQCRIFLSTDTGSTGLNLQTAGILINLDLPWNPAVLEQRIGRIYRIGQDDPIQVLNLVSKDSIEERMIDRLRFKRSLFEGALDGGDDTIFLSEDRFQGFMESLASLTPEASPRRGEKEDTKEDATFSEGDSPLLGEESEVRLFLSSLRNILQSPEKTKQLAEAITQILNET